MKENMTQTGLNAQELSVPCPERDEEIQRLKGMLKAQKEQYERQLEELKFQFALGEALRRAGARDPRTVIPLLDREKLSWQEGKISGLEEQLMTLRREAAYLFFESRERPRMSSSPLHGSPLSPSEPANLHQALSEIYG